MKCHLVALLLLATATRVASAQNPVDPRLATAVAALAPGLGIRISSADRQEDGRLLRATRESVVFLTRNGEQRALLAGVDSIWVRKRATGRGAAIGAIAGGVALSAFGVVFVNALCESAANCSGDYATVIPLGLIIGGFGGAVIGATVGSLSQRWRRVYP